MVSYLRHLGGRGLTSALYLLQLFDDDLDMLLSHAGKDKVPRLLIAMNLDRWIFFHDSVVIQGTFSSSALLFGSSKRNNRRKCTGPWY